MKRPTRPYQAILQRCARPYSSAPSPSPDSQPWPHLRRRARPSLLSQFDNTHDAQKSPESASSSSSPSSSSSKIGADSWLRELDRPETKRGWETKLRDRGAQHAFAENRNGSDESTGSRRAQAVRLDRQKGARGRQSETADPGPRNYEQDTFLQWLQDIAGPLEGGSGLDRDWGIRLRRDVVRPLPLKTRTATPELTRDEDQDHRLYGATSGTHSNTSTEDQGLSVTDLSKEIELRCYGARHLSNDDTKEDRAVFDRSVRREEPRGDHPGGDGGSELWLRHLARSDWGWERIDGTWTLRQTSDGTELVRTGMPAWTQERGVGVKENGLVAAEPPSVEIAAERRMITISGLSTNLTDRDFQRISPQPLSSWENTIKMVRQERDPFTFEPLGTYKLSFSTGFAATSYLHDLDCRHRVAKAKASSQFGLWENTVSRYLRKRHELEEEEARTKKTSPEDDTTIGPDAFTLAPPSIESLQIKRSRVVVKGWHKTLENIVKQLGHHPQAPIVLVDVYPPYLTSEQLEDFIKRDEHARGVSWHASKAVSLQPPEVRAKGQGPHQVMDMRVDHPTNSNKQEAKIVSKTPGRDEVRKGRFIIAFPTDTRAARFHRSWHQRTLTVTGPRDTVFHCTVNVQTVRW